MTTLRSLVLALALLLAAASAAPAEPAGERAIKDAVKKHIEENAAWPQDRIRVEFLKPVNDAALTAGTAVCQVRGRAGESYIGRTALAVRFCKGDTIVREETVRVRIEVLTDVVVSAQGLARDTVVGPSDVTATRKWMDRAPAAVLADPGAAIGKRTTARINAGTEITAAMLRSVPLVKRGEVVRILLESGPMTISAVGQSQEDGGQGDLIRVQNIASKRVIFARVTGHSQVRVEF